jgi:hypothetical protein
MPSSNGIEKKETQSMPNKKPKNKKSRPRTHYDRVLTATVQVVAPFMMNDDKSFRARVIAHLLDSHRAEVLKQVAVGVRKLGRERAKEAAHA